MINSLYNSCGLHPQTYFDCGWPISSCTTSRLTNRSPVMDIEMYLNTYQSDA